MITARALGVYVYLKASGAPISAESLSQAFPEGRKTFLTALKELRDHGLITTTRQVVNGKYVTQSYLSDGSPKSALLLQQTQQNSYLILNAYSLISKKEYLGNPGEGTNMSDYEPSPMYLDPEEREEFNRKLREKRAAEYREYKEQQATERIRIKAGRSPELWTSDDSAYHFAYLVDSSWHIKPWKTARTRFRAALAQARKTHGTTGDVELKMMERFFETLAHNKNIDDPDIVWKMFIKQFGALMLDVMKTTVTDQSIEDARAIADKQWGELDV